ncbi:MAG: SpoIIE family protein phosphatase [Thermoleophilia bacterium]|nr:SpoIIE family protein phosphatase [Thermoleophilia bacterium]
MSRAATAGDQGAAPAGELAAPAIGRSQASPPRVNTTLRLVGAALIVLLTALTSLVSYLFFHTVAEVVFAVVGFGALILSLTLREFLDDDFAVFMGVGLGAAALLHLVHMVDFPGMDMIVGSADHPTQVWLTARLLLAVTFVLAPAVLGRRLPIGAIALLYGVATALALASIYWWGVFPSAYTLAGGLTPFKVATEYVISALFVAAILLLWRRRALLPAAAFPLLVGALGASIAAELWFTVYSGPHTWPNMIGHVFLVLSAVLVYLGLIEDGLARPHGAAIAHLHAARRLHERLARSLAPTLPVRHHAVDVLRYYRPGDRRLELGGDFADVLEQRDGRLAVICGDVSGNGPDAAALGAMLRVGWSALVLSGASPSRIVRGLRAIVTRERQDPDTFATACLAWIDPEAGEVALLNAGHPPPLIIGGRVAPLAQEPIPPLGTLDVPVGEPGRFDLPADWSLVFYTDGLIEGRVAAGSSERFGEQRLIQTFADLIGAPLDREALERVTAAVERAAAAPFADDITLVVVSPRARRGG